MKILLVTRNTALVSAWRDTLAADGHDIDAALSCEEAYERARAGLPGLIFLDETECPQELLMHQLKADALTASLPVALLTGHAMNDPRKVLAAALAAQGSRRVLIAEDDRQMSFLLGAILSKNGFEVRASYDGLEALKEIKQWKPHLLVLDIMLPVVDGFHICQTMNEDHTYDPRPKVLITSGRSSDWDQNLGAACGAEYYMVKPFSNADFLQKVQEIMAADTAQ